MSEVREGRRKNVPFSRPCPVSTNGGGGFFKNHFLLECSSIIEKNSEVGSQMVLSYLNHMNKLYHLYNLYQLYYLYHLN